MTTYPVLSKHSVLFEEDKEAVYYDGYIGLSNGRYIKDLGDGRGRADDGTIFVSVYNTTDPENPEFLGWCEESDVTY